MKAITQIKLRPSSSLAALLIRTLKLANSACTPIRQVAWAVRIHRRVLRHYAVHLAVRSWLYLRTQKTIRSIPNGINTYRFNRNRRCSFRLSRMIASNNRILHQCKDRVEVLIWLVESIVRIPKISGEMQRRLPGSPQGRSDRVNRAGGFDLLATYEVDEPTPLEVGRILRVDLARGT